MIVNMIFLKFVSLTVFQSLFCNARYNAWETYLSDLTHAAVGHLQVISLLG